MKQSKKFYILENIYQLYGNDLKKFIYSLTRKDEFVTEEILQNTMVAALSGLNRLRDKNKMKSWIFAIAKAEAKRYYANPNNKILFEYSELENNMFQISEIDDFTKKIENKEILITLFNLLSDQEKQIYLLHYYYDLPLKEIAETLNINYNTVRSIHVRGLGKFRKFLMEGGLA